MEAAVAAIEKAASYTDPPAPPWTVAWLRGQVLRRQGRLEDAAKNFRSILQDPTGEIARRGFDFRNDYVVINILAETLREQARNEVRKGRAPEAERLRREAVAEFQKTLRIDSENQAAHKNLHELYKLLGESDKAARHGKLARRYDVDESRGSLAQKAKQT